MFYRKRICLTKLRSMINRQNISDDTARRVEIFMETHLHIYTIQQTTHTVMAYKFQRLHRFSFFFF